MSALALWEYSATNPFLGAHDGSSLGGRARWREFRYDPRQYSLRILPVNTVTAEIKKTFFDKEQEPISQLLQVFRFGRTLAQGRRGGLAGRPPALPLLRP